MSCKTPTVYGTEVKMMEAVVEELPTLDEQQILFQPELTPPQPHFYDHGIQFTNIIDNYHKPWGNLKVCDTLLLHALTLSKQYCNQSMKEVDVDGNIEELDDKT